jgi:uncharacterized membrane protein
MGPTGHGVPFAGGTGPTYLDPVEAFRWGFGALKAHLGAIVKLGLVVVVGYLLVYIPGILIVTGVGSRSPIVGLVLYAVFIAAATLFGLVLAKGLLQAMLTIADGRAPDVTSVLNFSNMGPYVLTGLLFMLGYMVGLVACILPGIAFGLLSQFWPYAVLDEGRDGVDAIRTSIETSLAHLGELLIFVLVAFGVNLLGLLACGVGLLVTMPTTYLAIVYAWRVMRGRPPAVNYA